MGNLHLLPQELIVEVLSHIPAESVFRFKCVCRTWRALLDDPYFADIHTGKLPLHYDRLSLLVSAKRRGYSSYQFFLEDVDYVDDDEQVCKSFSTNLNRPLPQPFQRTRNDAANYYFIGSCNGLVCLALNDYWPRHPSMFVYNPMTREYIKLANNDHGLEYIAHCHSVGGFGFHPITREYKIIRLHYMRQSPDKNVWNMQIHIYTLGSGIWRIKQGLPTSYYGFHSGLPFNGSVYWMSLMEDNIGFLDLEDEEFRTIPSPAHCANSSSAYRGGKLYKLLVLGGSLCVGEWEPNGIGIWVMKNDKNNHQVCSWTKNFNIPAKCEINQGPNTPNIAVYKTHSRIRPLLLTESGKIVCMCFSENTLFSYNPKTQSCFLIKDYAKDLTFRWQDITCMKSIVSLKAFQKEDVKMTTPVVAPAAQILYIKLEADSRKTM